VQDTDRTHQHQGQKRTRCGVFCRETTLPSARRRTAPAVKSAAKFPILATVHVYSLLMCISSIFSVSRLVSLAGGSFRKEGILGLLATAAMGFCAGRVALRRSAIHKALAASSMLGLCVGVYALGAALLDGEFLVSSFRVSEPLGNPIFLGAFLILTIPFTLASLLSPWSQDFAESGSHRRFTRVKSVAILNWVSVSLQLLTLVLTQSRGPWLGALAGLSLFAILVLGPRHRKWVLVVLALAVTLGAVTIVVLKADVLPAGELAQVPYVGRIVEATDMTGGTVKVRLILWEAALKVITTWPQVGLKPDTLHWLRPLIGYGPDTAAYVYMSAYPPELAHIEDPALIWDRAHNEILDIIVMRGWLGLLAVVLLALAVARRGYRLWRQAPDIVSRAWIAAPLAALLAHAVEVQFAFSTGTTRLVTWVCIGWLTALPVSASGGAATEETDVPTDPQRDTHATDRDAIAEPLPAPRRKLYVLIIATLIVGLLARGPGAYLLADKLVARARDLDRAREWEESLEMYDRALTLAPWSATYHQYRSEALFNLARALPEDQDELRIDLLSAADRGLQRARGLAPLDLELYTNAGIIHAVWAESDPSHQADAVRFYEQAFRLSPTRVSLRVDLGHIFHNLGQYDLALLQYADALAIAPHSVSAHYGSGLAWLASGDVEQARASLDSSLELKPNCQVCQAVLVSLDN